MTRFKRHRRRGTTDLPWLLLCCLQLWSGIDNGIKWYVIHIHLMDIDLEPTRHSWDGQLWNPSISRMRGTSRGNAVHCGCCGCNPPLSVHRTDCGPGPNSSIHNTRSSSVPSLVFDWPASNTSSWSPCDNSESLMDSRIWDMLPLTHPVPRLGRPRLHGFGSETPLPPMHPGWLYRSDPYVLGGSTIYVADILMYLHSGPNVPSGKPQHLCGHLWILNLHEPFASLDNSDKSTSQPSNVSVLRCPMVRRLFTWTVV